MSLQDRIKGITPLHDRILIKKNNSSEEITKGGIYIPEQAKERAQTGLVVAVGKGKPLPNGEVQLMSIKQNDEIFFGKFAGVEVGEDYIILREDEVLGIL